MINSTPEMQPNVQLTSNTMPQSSVAGPYNDPMLYGNFEVPDIQAWSQPDFDIFADLSGLDQICLC